MYATLQTSATAFWHDVNLARASATLGSLYQGNVYSQPIRGSGYILSGITKLFVCMGLRNVSRSHVAERMCLSTPKGMTQWVGRCPFLA